MIKRILEPSGEKHAGSPGGETIKRLIGWLMLLLGLLLLAGAVADSKVGGWLRAPNPPVVSAALTDIDRVSIYAGKVAVRVFTEARPDLAVAAHGSHSGWMDVRLTRVGSELQVRALAPWWHWPRNKEPIVVEVRLPETFPETLVVNISQGSLTIADASPERPLTLKGIDLHAQAANVELRHLLLGRFNFDAQAGALAADGLQAGEANLRLVTGKISLTHFAGAFQASLTSGYLEAQLDALRGPIRVNQVSGRLRLGLPTGAEFTLDASVGRGLIRSAPDLKGTPGTGASSVRGTRGAGTHAVELRLERGEITIE